MSRAELQARGATGRSLTAAVQSGTLIRVRRGRYLAAGCHPEVLRAATLGGRLDCVSLLRVLGVFVAEHPHLHVQVDVGDSRLPPIPPGVVRHWRTVHVPRESILADAVSALAAAVRCQPPRAAIATLDSALHHRLIDEDGLNAVFVLLPRRYRRLRGLLDGRCESGPESFVRLMLRSIGADIGIQVRIGGVGRVDFLVDGWLIVECDSEAHHADWVQMRRDRRRDLAATRLGFTTVRLLAEDILYHPDAVLDDLRSVISTGGARKARAGRRDRSI